MKVVAIVTTLAACAVTAVAQSGGLCNYNGNPKGRVVCCNSALPIVGQLLCGVAAIEETCNDDQKAYCCRTNALAGLVVVRGVNCIDL
ncbi:peptidase t2, asparaginase 2 [Fusarium flagelliforme]|uniref:Peptidase t2, asparaginase 2 n=1 Tax=Fusarium flagelliforme TaxID=2675880 RepID=A0A395N4G8_9HYPO|nr:peptidase t2, asparaginase 2 [Fusarium flagelliforme]